MSRKTFGVGVIGQGEYSHLARKINGKHTKVYSVWHDMLCRCYSKNFHKKRPTYIDCEVCEEWHNFQNFAKWYEENYYEIEGQKMCLDKDILFKRNKIYSPQTCMFVPQRINVLFTKRQNDRGEYPIGVSWVERDRVFRSYCSKYINGKNKNIYLGSYHSVEEAFMAYKNFKEEYIKEIADEYKCYIPIELYEALYRYKVEITD